MTVKYEIIPPYDRNFIVPKRIIGPKGKNLKKIILNCKKFFGQKVSKLIKIRLKGQEFD